MGITLVKTEAEVPAAMEDALKFDSEVLCEQYVALGREFRVGVLTRDDGALKMLPVIEYHLPTEKPIRTSADKLGVDAKGVPCSFTAAKRTCPAVVDDVLRAKLEAGAKRAHVGLGCRDYSLYDVRVGPDGEPYFLEAGLYCSFAPRSVIVMMAGALDDPSAAHVPLFRSMVRRAAVRKQQPSDGTQVLGMKRKAAVLSAPPASSDAALTA